MVLGRTGLDIAGVNSILEEWGIKDAERPAEEARAVLPEKERTRRKVKAEGESQKPGILSVTTQEEEHISLATQRLQ